MSLRLAFCFGLVASAFSFGAACADDLGPAAPQAGVPSVAVAALDEMDIPEKKQKNPGIARVACGKEGQTCTADAPCCDGLDCVYDPYGEGACELPEAVPEEKTVEEPAR